MSDRDDIVGEVMSLLAVANTAEAFLTWRKLYPDDRSHEA